MTLEGRLSFDAETSPECLKLQLVAHVTLFNDATSDQDMMRFSRRHFLRWGLGLIYISKLACALVIRAGLMMGESAIVCTSGVLLLVDTELFI